MGKMWESLFNIRLGAWTGRATARIMAIHVLVDFSKYPHWGALKGWTKRVFAISDNMLEVNLTHNFKWNL
jgi:hypothetical protein